MADTATLAAADTSIRAAKSKSTEKTKIEKPDEEAYKANLAEAEKAHASVLERLNAIKAKVDLVKPRDSDSPAAIKQKEYRAQLASIKQQQSGFKSSRGGIQEKISSLDAQLKNRITEQKTTRGRVPYKNVEEVDREIRRLEQQVDTGKMKLVDEKKALAEVSSLRKQRKAFVGFDVAQKGIDDLKAQIVELRKGLDNPDSRALSDKYNEISKALDQIKVEQDSLYKNLHLLRDERTQLQAEQQLKRSTMREIKDRYHKARVAYRDWEQEQYELKRERERVARADEQKEKRKRVAAQKLEEASEPAYLDEILTAEGLIRYFDPTTPVASKSLKEPSGFAAEAQRTIDDSSIKGTRISRKEDRDDTYFMGSGGKKGKKGKKGNGPSLSAPATVAESKFNLNSGVMQELGKVGVEAPASHADVTTVLEKLRGKLDHWKRDQDIKTKENIAKAQAEIDRLEADAIDRDKPSSSRPNHRRTQDHAKKPAEANLAVNGKVSAEAELAQETDADADVVEDLKKASIEDRVEK